VALLEEFLGLLTRSLNLMAWVGSWIILIGLPEPYSLEDYSRWLKKGHC